MNESSDKANIQNQDALKRGKSNTKKQKEKAVKLKL